MVIQIHVLFKTVQNAVTRNTKTTKRYTFQKPEARPAQARASFKFWQQNDFFLQLKLIKTVKRIK